MYERLFELLVMVARAFGNGRASGVELLLFLIFIVKMESSIFIPNIEEIRFKITIFIVFSKNNFSNLEKIVMISKKEHYSFEFTKNIIHVKTNIDYLK